MTKDQIINAAMGIMECMNIMWDEYSHQVCHLETISIERFIEAKDVAHRYLAELVKE